MTKRVVFVATKTLLDTASGAALSVHAMLEALTEAGYTCSAFTGLLFDPRTEVPLTSVLGPKANQLRPGQIARTTYNGVEHRLFRFQSTYGGRIEKDEVYAFLEAWHRHFENIKPDIVISYGSSQVAHRLQDVARQAGVPLVLYVATAEFKKPQMFQPNDIVIHPSEFLKNYYSKTFGLEGHITRNIVRDPVKADRFCGADAYALARHRAARRCGFITMINPSPEKGFTLFLRLVGLARQERPDLTFLALEGRRSRQEIADAGVNLDALTNVWWLPNQKDMQRVYARTSILLFPSFWQEASGRSLVEAQLCGIPVLAANRGGIPENLNGGGFLFDIPERCTENYNAVPTADEVRPWLDTITRLMDDEVAYREASQRALKAAEPFQPEKRKREIVAFFDGIVGEATRDPAHPS